MAQPATPRGHEVHKKRIASDTAEWHRRLDELVEIRREAAEGGRFGMTAGKPALAPRPNLFCWARRTPPIPRRAAKVRPALIGHRGKIKTVYRVTTVDDTGYENVIEYDEVDLSGAETYFNCIVQEPGIAVARLAKVTIEDIKQWEEK
jgi:hypothetical protein